MTPDFTLETLFGPVAVYLGSDRLPRYGPGDPALAIDLDFAFEQLAGEIGRTPAAAIVLEAEKWARKQIWGPLGRD